MMDRVNRLAGMGVMVGGIAMGAAVASAHPGHDDPVDDRGALAASAEDRLAESQVEIVVRNGFRHITSNGIPNHDTGAFPNRRNPNSIRPQAYAFRVTAKPVV